MESLILGLETSCDETAAAVVRGGRVVLSNVIASQHELHSEYGGVVPEIASRAHLERLLPVVDESLHEAGVSLRDLTAIAVGHRPGLIGSLLVGVSAAKALAWSLGLPLVGVNHVQAHLYAGDLVPDTKLPMASADFAVSYPAVGLVVSGGHTSLYAVTSPTEMHRLGKTIDDAAGEAYDKAAVILGAGYPGGAQMDALAQQGDAGAEEPLPRSLLESGSLDFSFSGVKTALLYRVRGKPLHRGEHATFSRSAEDLSDAERANLAAAFQEAVAETLVTKLGRAVERMRQRGQPARRIITGGGVSANSRLRQLVTQLGAGIGVPVTQPAMALCVDNAAMIAGLGHHRWAAGQTDDLTLTAAATAGA